MNVFGSVLEIDVAIPACRHVVDTFVIHSTEIHFDMLRAIRFRTASVLRNPIREMMSIAENSILKFKTIKLFFKRCIEDCGQDFIDELSFVLF